MKKLTTLIAVTAVITSCNMGGNKNNAMDDRIEKNKAAMMMFYDQVMNKHNIVMIDSCVAADYVDHNPDPSYAPTRDGFKKDMANFFIAFPDLNVKTNIIVTDTMYSVVHSTLTGTNTGSMMGMPPTGKKVSVDGIDIIQFVNGKAVEHWGLYDQMKFMTQMGMMPPMGGSDSSKMKMQ